MPIEIVNKYHREFLDYWKKLNIQWDNYTTTMTENHIDVSQEMFLKIKENGYIEKNKVVSLKGTLVPATTINKTIGAIPLLGDILVGKKSGEGIFGVSFKIKGPPNDLKSTVNPIKTLTPRFITRTLENLKGN